MNCSRDVWEAHCALHGLIPLPQNITLRNLRVTWHHHEGQRWPYMLMAVHAQECAAVTELTGYIPTSAYGVEPLPHEIGSCEVARFFLLDEPCA